MRASAGVRLKEASTDAPAERRDGRIAVVAPAIRTVRLRIALIGVAAVAEDSLIG
jgi:hypothetical protein